VTRPEALITAENVDLSNCDREQIQYAGAILPHGVLLTLSEPELQILQVSANTEDLLGVPPNRLLGQPLGMLFDQPRTSAIRGRLQTANLAAVPCLLLRTVLHGAEFDAFAHRCGGVLIMELEKCAVDQRSALFVFADFREAVARLQATGTLQEFLDAAVTQIREFTGIDRVMAYKFMEDGSGWVRSESLAEGAGFTPYLGLHYPASDIPQPARRLFSLTWLRHQPDIGYTPVPITPAVHPLTGAPLDLSYALLRSVSVMYSQYLKNMGTTASMVMTLMKDGKLWGLIACHHHRGPKHIPYEVRTACEFLANMVSLLMSAKENQENEEYRARLESTRSVLVEQLAQENDFSAGLMQRVPSLLDFVSASGAALAIDGHVETLGQLPSEAYLLSLVKWLARNMGERDTFATNGLAAHLAEAESYKEVGSGLLALRLAKLNHNYLLWFRPEQIHTVNWAGDPHKPVGISADGQRLTPRGSFALWTESVRLKSEPWLEVEIAAATHLRSTILALALERPEKLGRLYDDLARSHSQLDEFSYVASHDLKEPLRGIHNLAEMLQEDYGGKLGEEGRQRLATLSRLSQRMDDLLSSLLEFSRVGRADFADVQVDLNQVVAEALEVLRPRIEEQKTEIRLLGTLPAVRGDRSRLGEVFVNLIGNAIKYNDKARKWVEIGIEPMPGTGSDGFFVRDNGIGILPGHFEEIFQIFRRLHGRDEFGGGSGAGLTITRKIIEKHGGRIIVESTPGVGTTFRFTLATERI
jgi:light-regulated signal transduction histidine kinase (bacteriophytochrome)